MKKICSKCEEEFSATLKYFYKDNQKKDKLRSDCKICVNERNYSYRKSNHSKSIQRKAICRHRKTLKGYICHIFHCIKSRCYNSNHPAYKNYGGRGIKCKFKSMNDFRNYIINGLQIDPRGLEIDRINNNGHYEKGNIRFVTHKENNYNKRNTKCQ